MVKIVNPGIQLAEKRTKKKGKKSLGVVSNASSGGGEGGERNK